MGLRRKERIFREGECCMREGMAWGGAGWDGCMCMEFGQHIFT